MVSGDVSFVFGIWNAESGGGAACYTSAPMVANVATGRFSVVIGPVTPSCVSGKDVWVSVSVDDGTGSVALPGRQRIYPGLASVSSGAGHFHVGGDLVVTGTASAASLSVTTATVTGNAAVNGDLVVAGEIDIGFYAKSCYYNDVGGSDACYCNAGDRIISGGYDCDYNDGVGRAGVYSEALGSTGWYVLRENTDVAGQQETDPIENQILCARAK